MEGRIGDIIAILARLSLAIPRLWRNIFHGMMIKTTIVRYAAEK
jgi:hypothetical protein